MQKKSAEGLAARRDEGTSRSKLMKGLVALRAAAARRDEGRIRGRETDSPVGESVLPSPEEGAKTEKKPNQPKERTKKADAQNPHKKRTDTH